MATPADDDLEEIVSEIEGAALVEQELKMSERLPWSYMGWIVFCNAKEPHDGKPVAIRPGDILAVRPGNANTCGLTLRDKDVTMVVYGDFLTVLDIMPEKIA